MRVALACYLQVERHDVDIGEHMHGVVSWMFTLTHDSSAGLRSNAVTSRFAGRGLEATMDGEDEAAMLEMLRRAEAHRADMMPEQSAQEAFWASAGGAGDNDTVDFDFGPFGGQSIGSDNARNVVSASVGALTRVAAAALPFCVAPFRSEMPRVQDDA